MGKGADVGRGEDIRVRGREGGGDHDAAVDRKAGGLGQAGARDRADADHHGVGFDAPAVVQGDREAIATRRDLAWSGAQQNLDSGGGVTRLQERRERGRHGPAQEPRRQLDHHRPAAQRDGAGGDLEPDEAAADDRDPGARPQLSSQPDGVPQTAQIQHPLCNPGIERQPAGLAAGRQEQLPVGDPLAILETDGPVGAIDRLDHASGAELDARRLERRRPGEGEVIRRPLAGEVGLGQRRPLVGRAGLGTEQHDPAIVAEVAQRERGAPAALAGADDHHRRVAHPLPAETRAPFVPSGRWTRSPRWPRAAQSPMSIRTLPSSSLTG